MNIAFLGCGYVAEQYANALPLHPELSVVGAYDRVPAHVQAFAARVSTRAYASFDELLADDQAKLVINLTNPRSHFDLNARLLEAGKHVYSEKPLAMTLDEAQSLKDLAVRLDLQLASAPSSLLGETAQTLWRAVRGGAVGHIRLVYANFDDGMIAPAMEPWTWRNQSGVPWPARDEFEVGCTFEHAGYVVTWLCAMFGPALAVTAFASTQITDKGIAVDVMAPDFSVGCIEFADGVVARVTCGLVAERDKSITVIGDQGSLFVGNVRDEAAPVMLRRSSSGGRWRSVARRSRWLRHTIESRLGLSAIDALDAETVPAARPSARLPESGGKRVDFMRGPAEVADAIATGRRSRLPADFGVHLVEILEALQYPARFGHRRSMTTTFGPIAPMPWAAD